jgi:hypothetical protein
MTRMGSEAPATSFEQIEIVFVKIGFEGRDRQAPS